MSALKDYLVIPYAQIVPCSIDDLDYLGLKPPAERVLIALENRKTKRKYLKISSYDGTYLTEADERVPVKVYRVSHGIPFELQFGLRLNKSRKKDGGHAADLRAISVSFHELPQWGKPVALFSHPYIEIGSDSYAERILESSELFESAAKETALSPNDFANSRMKRFRALVMDGRIARETMIKIEFRPILTSPDTSKIDPSDFLAKLRASIRREGLKKQKPLEGYVGLRIKLQICNP